MKGLGSNCPHICIYDIGLKFCVEKITMKCAQVMCNHKRSVQFIKRERESYCMQAYLSSIQHKNLTPYRFVINSSKRPLTRQFRLFVINYGVKLTFPKQPPDYTLFQDFMLDEWEVHSYMIIPSLPTHYVINMFIFAICPKFFIICAILMSFLKPSKS
jgi:hypothetical protein